MAVARGYSVLALLLVACADLAAAQCLAFTLTPQDIVATQGDDVCFQCDYPNEVDTETWERNGNPIQNGTEPCNCFVNEMVPGTALCFTALEDTDAGMYSCIEGSMCSANATLYVADDRFVLHPVDTTVSEGGSTTFSCRLESNSLTFQWQFIDSNNNQTFLLNNMRYMISPSDGSLTLNNVSAEDEGQYRCAYEVGEGVYLYSNSATLTNQAVLCPDPPALVNGMVTFTGNSVGDTATYTCDSGFELVGSAIATCGQVNANSAVFSPAPPECRPLCPDPPALVNGMVTFTGNSVGDTATYTCDSGFELVGSAIAPCGQVNANSAVFLPAPPECRPLCPDPADIVNGTVTFTGNSVGDTVNYTCSLGFELIGSVTATCMQVDVNSAVFSPAASVCRPLCPDPAGIVNGMVTFTGNSVGDTATYTCDSGFELIGSATATCMQVDVNTAAFSPVPPVCSLMCPDPSDIANGTVTFTGNSVGDTATYTCDSGFELVGSAIATCGQVNANSAVFSPTAPVCRPLCPDPTDIVNGMVTFTGNSVGDIATYTCNSGFELVGSVTAMCGQVNVNSAVFSPAPPECRPLCPDPPALVNGMVTFTGNSVGDIATYTCDSGFELVGSATAMCGQVNVNSAVFSPAPPECTPIVEFGFRDLTFSVGEGDGTVSLCLRQMGTIPDESTVTLMVSTVDNTATEGPDFVSFSTTFVFDSSTPVIDCVEYVHFAILEDLTGEGTETFTVTLSSDCPLVGFFNQSVSVNIMDNDALLQIFQVRMQAFDQDPFTPWSVDGVATVVIGGLGTPMFHFDCYTTSGNGSQIMWSARDMPLQLPQTSLPFGQRLEAGGISLSQLGVYVCQDEARDEERAINITDSNPVVSAVEETRSTFVGGVVELLVYANGFPSLMSSQITWYRPDSSVISDDDENVAFYDDRRRMVLTNVQLENAGLYTCEAEVNVTIPVPNTVSRASASIQLEVYQLVEIGFQDQMYAVSEEEGSVSLCVQLDGTIPDGSPVIFSVSTVEGNATDLSDFESFSQTYACVANAPMANCIELIDLAILDDSVVEGTEVFSVVLSSPTPFVSFTNQTATVIIVDNDALMISFEQDTYIVSEAENAEVCFLVEGELAEDITAGVTITTADDTAQADEDYQELVTDVVLMGSRHCQNVSIVDDDTVENEEVFRVSLSSTEECIVFTTTSTSVNILDNDVLTVGFQMEEYDFSEDDSSALVCVSVESGALAQGLVATVTVAAEDITTEEGPDYELSETAISFSADVTTSCITIFIQNDDEAEGVEMFSLYLNTTDVIVQLGTSRATIAIADSIAFAVVPLSTTAVLDSTATFQCTSSMEVEVLSIMWNVDGTLATDSSIVDRGISFATGDVPGGLGSTLSVPATTENNNAMIRCVLQTSFGLRASDTARLTVQALMVGIENDSYFVDEDAGYVEICITAAGLNLLEDMNATVTLSTVNGTALAGSDFQSVEDDTRLLALGSRTCVNITIIDDNVAEIMQAFLLTLNTNDDFVVLSEENATVSIIDNDFVMVGFRQSEYTVNEDSGSLQVLVDIVGTLEGDLPAESLLVQLEDSEAQLDFDEFAMDITYGLPLSPTTISINLSIIDDDLPEGSESFYLVLDSTYDFIIFATQRTQVTIVDNDLCGNVTCQNGVCDNEIFICVCNPFFTGPDCGMPFIPPPEISISTDPPVSEILAGEMISIKCEVTAYEDVLQIRWVDPEGMPLNTDSQNINVGEVEPLENGAALVVNISVRTSHAGLYTCEADINSEISFTVTAQYGLVVRLPPPDVVFVFHNQGRSVYAGSAPTISCSIGQHSAVDTPTTASAQWLPDSVYQNSRIMVTEPELLGFFYTSQLVFDLAIPSDSANYTCEASFVPDEDTAFILPSGSLSGSQEIIVEAPPLSATINPESAVVPNAASFNTYSFTCNATVDVSVSIMLGFQFSWQNATTGMPMASSDVVIITTSATGSVIAVTEDTPGMYKLSCIVQAYVMTSQESEFVAMATSEDANVTVTGPAFPAAPQNVTVVGVSHELAIIQWTVPAIAYTPETYRISYRISGTGDFVTAGTVAGITDLSTADEVFSFILDELQAGTEYDVRVEAVNTIGSSAMSVTFQTREGDLYTLLASAGDIEVPLGAMIEIVFEFIGQPGSSQYRFVPLGHSPLQLPNITVTVTSQTEVAVAYTHASPSLSGSYVLCQAESCGRSISITVTIPTLTISTNLLVVQAEINGNINSGQVFCTPSDPLAPVQWKNNLGFLPTEFSITFSPQGLSHTATFYGDPFPDQTEFFVCDLINQDEPDQPVDPQNVTVRFVSTPVAITNDGRELTTNAVINEFRTAFSTNQPLINLSCFGISGHGDLQWQTRDVESLPTILDSTSASEIDGLEVFDDFNPDGREIVFSYQPVNNQSIGYYSCLSVESGYEIDVYTTLTDPLWELVSPTEYDVPLGVEITIRARFADASYGYRNLGQGFSFQLTFIPCTETQPEQSLASGITDEFSNEFVYSFLAGMSDAGVYQLSAIHITSGKSYFDEVNVTRISVPYIQEHDVEAYVQRGMYVTLQCIPSDLRAPVLWGMEFDGFIPFLEEPELFAYSPPGLNHTITFNATAAALLFQGFLNEEEHGFFITCGVIDGDNSGVPFNPVPVDLYIVPYRMRLQHRASQIEIFNNTVINYFVDEFDSTRRKRREVSGPPTRNPLSDLNVICIAVQGDHMPVWITDNPSVVDDNGDLPVDESNDFSARTERLTDYTVGLFISTVTEQSGINGTYQCISEESGLFTQFYLSLENPFVRRISPAVIVVDEGDSVSLEFQVAVNSDGNFWIESSIFFFTSRITGLILPRQFNVRSGNYPQNYVFDINTVTRFDDGVYTARVNNFLCESPEFCPDPFVERNITLQVILYCPQDANGGILWPRTRQGEELSVPCTNAGSFYTSGPMATRQCMDSGEWAPTDITGCTLAETSESFVLLWLVVEADEISSEQESQLEDEIAGYLDEFNVAYTDVTLQSVYIASVSLTFVVSVPESVVSDPTSLNSFLTFFTTELETLGGLPALEGRRGFLGVTPADSCPCRASGASNETSSFLDLCQGSRRSPCACTDGDCVCRDPFVGDGISCTLDSDGDGFPDQALQSDACQEGSDETYCTADVCIEVYNPGQDPAACQPAEFDGCPFGPDPQWNITWASTPTNTYDVQRCPGGVNTLGNATRFCGEDGEWEEPDVLECLSLEFLSIRTQADELFTAIEEGTVSSQEIAAASASLTTQMIVATETVALSLLPADLNVTNNVVSGLIDTLINGTVEDDTTVERIVDIFDNLLEETNTEGWQELQTVTAGSQALLDNAENYGLYLASVVTNQTNATRVLSRSNIVIRAQRVEAGGDSELIPDIVFPVEGDLVNFLLPENVTTPPAQITIPSSLISTINVTEGETIPVVHILFQNLGEFLPSSIVNFNNSRGGSAVISTQLGAQEAIEGAVIDQQALLLSPISLSFRFEAVPQAVAHQCVYWNFSEPVGNGFWSSNGVRVISNSTENNVTTIQCQSVHLTSFAVLVDVEGGLQGISEAERKALQIVSYIGCTISSVCLIISIVFFIMQGKKLFTAVHLFVHLNLAISLLLGYLTFMLGIELAASSTGGCAFVAALLQYLFLSAFCWMLCEGIMLYLMLVVVFSTLSKKWWIFLLIGYCVPIPFVVIGLAARHDYYGVRVNGNLEFCWLSSEKGTIWAFVAPMLAIILVNVVFLCLALRSLWRNRRAGLKRNKDTEVQKLATTIFRATIILLPLLGLTWAFGILTLNRNATVFAWFFTVFNSLQGLGILFFHVIRNERVWSKIGPQLTALRQRTLKSSIRSYVPTDASTSSTIIKGTYKRKPGDHGTLELGSVYRNPISEASSPSQLESEFTEKDPQPSNGEVVEPTDKEEVPEKAPLNP